MNYLIVVAIQFFRWALVWIAREFVLLIIMSLVTNFFEEIKQLLLTFMVFIKDKVFTIFNKISELSSEIESKLSDLTTQVDRLSSKINNFTTFVVDKSSKIKISLSTILDDKIQRIKNLLETKIVSKLNEIKEDVNNLPIQNKDKKRIIKKLDSAASNIDKVVVTADSLQTKINMVADKQLTQITNNIPTLPNIDTTELTEKMEDLTKMILDSNKAINDEIDLIYSKFDEQQIKDILENQILNADDDIFDNASDIVSKKIKKKIKTPDAKKIKWLNLDHGKKANTKHAKNFKINDIYRILVENFDEDERIALALRFAEKDHFRLRK